MISKSVAESGGHIYDFGGALVPYSIDSPSPQRAIVTLSDEPIAAGVSALRSELRSLVMDGACVVVIDVSDIGQIESTLLGALLDTHRICRRRGGGVVIRHADRKIADLLHRTGLDEIFDVEDKSLPIEPGKGPQAGG